VFVTLLLYLTFFNFVLLRRDVANKIEKAICAFNIPLTIYMVYVLLEQAFSIISPIIRPRDLQLYALVAFCWLAITMLSIAFHIQLKEAKEEVKEVSRPGW
jgi:hypothetical protein